jgi:hypothetical protein
MVRTRIENAVAGPFEEQFVARERSATPAWRPAGRQFHAAANSTVASWPEDH